MIRWAGVFALRALNGNHIGRTKMNSQMAYNAIGFVQILLYIYYTITVQSRI